MSKSDQVCDRRISHSDFGIPSDFVIRHSDLKSAVPGGPPSVFSACIGTMNRVWKVAQTAQSAVSQVANQLCSAEDLL